MFKLKLKVFLPKNLEDFEKYFKRVKNINHMEKFTSNIESGIFYLLVILDIGYIYKFKDNGNFEYMTFSGTKFYRNDFWKVS